jgi:iron complex outermembrane receptor protein
VVVTGVPHDRAPGELAQSVTVLRGDALDRARAANLGETLANQLGVSSSFFGSGASRPIIRGLAGARVQTLEDGIDSMDASSLSDDHAVGIEPLSADQIEIFRGPTALLYGSGAVGGVINTVTTRIPASVPEGGFAGAAEVRGDSAADARGVAVRLDGGAASFAWHFDAATRDSEDYEIPGFARREPGAGDVAGVLENSAAQSDAAALGASWIGDDGFIGMAVNTFDTVYGIPGDEEETVRIDLGQTRVDLKGGWMNLPGLIEVVNLRVGVNDYEHVELEGEEIGTYFTNDAVEARLELLHRAAGRWSGAFGVQMGKREFAAIGEEAFVPPVDTSTSGIFVVEELELDVWQLSFGGRVESQEQRPTGGSPDVDATARSVSFAGVRELASGDHSLALNLALSERVPVAEELYSDGPHLATGVVQVGDPSLDAETAQHIDVGVRGEAGDLHWGVTVFATSYDDFIYLADTGSVDPVDDLPIFAYAQRDADFTGIEAELFTPIASVAAGEVDLRLFTDFVRGELRGGEPLPRLPPLRYGMRVQYHDERVLLGLEATRYADQDETAAFELPTDGYTLVNADFRWRLAAAGGAELEVFVNASNLGNDEARKHTSFVKDIAPLPGRNYAVGVRSRF